LKAKFIQKKGNSLPPLESIGIYFMIILG